ncbi:MAG TPA: DUF1641 domain-containing protein [Bacteroidales bacterium]|nr:DUF1641 domain-containing protein [Bacteroidales bacterium]HOK75118.1 DUF1641 domain-containing protein [Bacteroidales bacterium]HOM40708.1 DUF1641 domain-containing protein [Bacteroidales bacterium]HPP92336.1 DUF1641 domain-containing protein [Bacteroidales bacterium]HRR16884.1 DUF1641 domain-containing protein [Bacteroidales bacterium]
MANEEIQKQIDEINRKLDLLLEDASVRKQNQEALNDLADDISLISKEAFKYLVNDLDNAGVELDSDALRCLIIKSIRNLANLGRMIDTIESINDLLLDVEPILRQIGLDGIRKLNEIEQKGYFDLINQFAVSVDKIMSRYSREEINKISDNIVIIADIIINLTNKQTLKKVHAVSVALKELDLNNIEEVSVWKLLFRLNRPEVKKSIGFLMAFLEKLNNTETEIN